MPAGLENPRCFRSVLDILQREGPPVAITMRTHIEKRYGQTSSGILGRMADMLNRAENLQRHLAQASSRDQGCKACAGPVSAKLAVITHCARSMDVSGVLDSANGLGDMPMGGNRKDCADCTGMTSVQAADIAKAAKGIERAVVRNAFGIVEG